jgi:hypothetical protein
MVSTIRLLSRTGDYTRAAMEQGKRFKTLEEAEDAARDNLELRKKLAESGQGCVMVADISNGGAYEVRDVRVIRLEDYKVGSSTRILMEVDGRTCPVCGRTVKVDGQWVSYPASGTLMTGLDPEDCVGCFDTYRAYGGAPIKRAPDGTTVRIERPS